MITSVTIRKQCGATLIMSIFIIVILGAASLWMIQLATVQTETALFSLQANQVYYAATSGLQWGMHEAIDNNACPATATINFTQGGLNGFRATVTCSATTYNYNAGADTFNVYELISLGEQGTFGDHFYAAKEVRMYITDAN